MFHGPDLQSPTWLHVLYHMQLLLTEIKRAQIMFCLPTQYRLERVVDARAVCMMLIDT